MPARPAAAQLCAGLFISALLAACASQAPKSTAGLDQPLPLKSKDPGTLVYRSPTIDPKQYKALLIDNTLVVSGAGTDFGKTSPQDQQRLATLLTTDLNDELRKRNYPMATAPGPGVVRVHTSLIGITESEPAAATLLRLTPVGIGASVLSAVRDKPAAFTGSVTISGEMTDSVSGEVLAGFVARESPLALDLSSGLGTLRAAELGVERGVRDFADALDRNVRGAK
jgi:hypothetical protein